jgi:uncharacterized membrane-anchored protein
MGDRELVSAALDERLSLFVVVKDVASIVVTCIVLSVIGFIIVSAICLRYYLKRKRHAELRQEHCASP